jgi:beta-galactosidase GanA
MAYYVGAYLDEAAQQELVARIVKNAGITVIRTPEGIEMSTRVHPTYGDLYFLINHTNNLQAMWLPWLVKEHLTGQTSLSRVELAPYGVAVVSQEK